MDLSWALGHSRTDFYHAPQTIQIPLRTPKQNEKTKSLDTFCRDAVPPCKLNSFLFSGHLQTIYTAFKKENVPVHYRRHVFESTYSTYPGSFAVDFVTLEPAQEADPSLHSRTTYLTDEEWRAAGSDDSRPMLVCLHGIGGGSHESYVRKVLYPLTEMARTASDDKQKWEACVVNARGCALSTVTSDRLFNARATWDIRQAVHCLREKFPNRPLFGLGFSLGANIMTNYLGEEGDRCELQAAIVISNPWNLEVGSLALQRTWIGLELYSRVLCKSMKKLFERNVEQISQNKAIDVEKVRQSRYLHEFDRYVQGPTWGYPTEGAYYRDASSIDSVFAIRTPLLAIHATDDPVTSKEALPYEEVTRNPYVVLCTTNWGGHLGWFEFGGTQWFIKPVINFFRNMAENVDSTSLKTRARNGDYVEVQNIDASRYEPMRRRLNIEC